MLGHSWTGYHHLSRVYVIAQPLLSAGTKMFPMLSISVAVGTPLAWLQDQAGVHSNLVTLTLEQKFPLWKWASINLKSEPLCSPTLVMGTIPQNAIYVDEVDN